MQFSWPVSERAGLGTGGATQAREQRGVRTVFFIYFSSFRSLLLSSLCGCKIHAVFSPLSVLSSYPCCGPDCLHPWTRSATLASSRWSIFKAALQVIWSIWTNLSVLVAFLNLSVDFWSILRCIWQHLMIPSIMYCNNNWIYKFKKNLQTIAFVKYPAEMQGAKSFPKSQVIWPRLLGHYKDVRHTKINKNKLFIKIKTVTNISMRCERQWCKCKSEKCVCVLGGAGLTKV